ncbi:hypothetical protein JCM4914_57990 [Streptomyces platensis subsp. malvinus]
MSSPPPTGPPAGPPSGPLPGHTPVPGTPPPRRPWWRTPPVLVGAGIGVVGIGVALAFILSAGGDYSPNANSGEPSSIPSVDSPAAARTVVNRVTLKPADWGSGYVAEDPYETRDLTDISVDQNCDWAVRSINDAFATLLRSSRTSDKTAFTSARTTVYKAADPARYRMSQQREALQRCPTQKSGKSRIENVHEISIPELKGFDEVVAEEGHQVLDENGEKVDVYYTYLTGRKANYVMTSEVDRSGTETQEQNRNDASSALSLMLSRLEGGASY